MLTGLAVIQKVIPGLRPLPGSTFRGGKLLTPPRYPRLGMSTHFFDRVQSFIVLFKKQYSITPSGLEEMLTVLQ